MLSCLSFPCNTIPLYNNQCSSSSQGSATLSIRSRHKRFATILEICPNRPIKAHLCLRRQDAPLDLACCRQLPLTYRGLGCKRSDYLSPARPHDKYLASSLISRLSAVASLIPLKLLATSLPPVGLTHIRPFCFFLSCHVKLLQYSKPISLYYTSIRVRSSGVQHNHLGFRLSNALHCQLVANKNSVNECAVSFRQLCILPAVEPDLGLSSFQHR